VDSGGKRLGHIRHTSVCGRWRWILEFVDFYWLLVGLVRAAQSRGHLGACQRTGLVTPGWVGLWLPGPSDGPERPMGPSLELANRSTDRVNPKSARAGQSPCAPERADNLYVPQANRPHASRCNRAQANQSRTSRPTLRDSAISLFTHSFLINHHLFYSSELSHSTIVNSVIL
jgi:hypothetical protein